MTTVNGASLYNAMPIAAMKDTKVYDHGVSHGQSEAGYDIRIKQEIRFTKGLFGRRIVIRTDPIKGQDAVRGRFTIASAIEHFHMPAHLLGIVHDKSSWARKGLSVFNTVIEPGWKGYLTLELVYHGNDRLVIPAGSGIAQVVFSLVSDPVVYTGRYQNQEDRPVEAIHSKNLLNL